MNIGGECERSLPLPAALRDPFDAAPSPGLPFLAEDLEISRPWFC